jgi:hypothetical protein
MSLLRKTIISKRGVKGEKSKFRLIEKIERKKKLFRFGLTEAKYRTKILLLGDLPVARIQIWIQDPKFLSGFDKAISTNIENAHKATVDLNTF